ncbi:MAG: hypothetical protein V4550_11475 [Gemmatimonadota bacterium]
MPPTLPPYALAAPAFRFRHLANLAGRAQIGGAREVALACFVAARLAAESAVLAHDDPDALAERAAGAKAWLGAITLPAAIRGPVTRCAELSAGADRAPVSRELASLLAAATMFLDAPSRNEMQTLIAVLSTD